MKKIMTDKILIRHLFFTIYGWTLFIVVNLIQFLIVPFLIPFSMIFDRNRVLFSYVTKFFSRLFFFLYFVEWINFDNNGLKPPKKGEKRIYVINHASQYDVILMYLMPGPIKFLFKQKWAKLPFIGWIAALSRNLVVRDDMTAAEIAIVFKKATKYLENRIPFIIFPEGTRSTNGKIGNFFHGTFKLALDNQADIVPVVFDSWNCIRPGALWIRDTRPTIKILNTIKYDDIKHLNFGKVSHLVRTKMIEGLIKLRDERRAKEKKYYRHIEVFKQIDDEMRNELSQLIEYSEKKSISLLSDSKHENDLNIQTLI